MECLETLGIDPAATREVRILPTHISVEYYAKDDEGEYVLTYDPAPSVVIKTEVLEIAE